MDLISRHLELNLKDPDSVRRLQISQPVADCHGRGHPGRRDVCGYRICFEYNARNGFGGYVGRQVRVFWLYQGFTPMSYDNAGGCPNQFVPWKGDPPVEVRDFCALQPKNDGCLAGQKETYAQLSLEESVRGSISQGADGGAAAGSPCTDEFKDSLRAKGLSYADIDDVCRKADD